ncbi:uncharacterized protein ARMOST_06268 [Armillaria ostoyae]|uniref:Uncharacterized protein n=1 Tax=Armillaria ostoyae TaxID=47428 RepID=A0A284R2I0_ARMOS|nr:uncharacterized protein ARMOST_06268 [Armillaria ostoyae]
MKQGYSPSYNSYRTQHAATAVKRHILPIFEERRQHPQGNGYLQSIPKPLDDISTYNPITYSRSLDLWMTTGHGSFGWTMASDGRGGLRAKSRFMIIPPQIGSNSGCTTSGLSLSILWQRDVTVSRFTEGGGEGDAIHSHTYPVYDASGLDT